MSTTSTTPVLRRFGKYRVLGPLGSGGMGDVYRARDTLLRREVALKLLVARNPDDPDSLRRFIHEARSAVRLDHPHTVSVYEIDQQRGQYYIAMELLAGGSGLDALRARGAMPWPEATRWIADACRGLIAVHAAGLIHRDIKPANLLSTSDGVVKLADFGLVKFHEPTKALTQPGQIPGTPDYMSPEQCRGEGVDARSDLYSLGATYFALLTGRPPFAGEQPIQVMFAHCSQPPPDACACVDNLPAECGAIVQRAMSKQPADRFAAANEMLAALEALLEVAAATGVAAKVNAASTPAGVHAASNGAVVPTSRIMSVARGSWLGWSLGAIALLVAGVTFVKWPRADGTVAASVANETASPKAEAMPTATEVSRSDPPKVQRNKLTPAEERAARASISKWMATVPREQQLNLRDALERKAHDTPTGMTWSLRPSKLTIDDSGSVTLDVPPTSIALSSDGAWEAWGNGGLKGGITLRARGETAALQLQRGTANDLVSGLAFVDQGDQLVATMVDDVVRLRIGERLARREMHLQSPPTRAAIRRDGEQLWVAAAVKSRDADIGLATIYSFKLAERHLAFDGSEPRMLAQHRGRVRDVAIAKDADRAATVGDDGEARLWQASNGQPIGSCSLYWQPDANVSGSFVRLSGDGVWMAVGSGRYVALWRESRAEKPQWLECPSGKVLDAAFSDDGRQLLVATTAQIALWRVDAPKQPPRVAALPQRPTQAMIANVREGKATLMLSAERWLRRWDIDEKVFAP